ncbi:hypothetical protein [Paraburkholderia fungorum]|uniref:hypothetical protein n=1 Tax=Paraburkholderia fungorum TaxID=134537 RepID=UPI0038BA606B
MIWPLNGSTPVQSTTASVKATLASQITSRQFQIPFAGIRLKKIPVGEILWAITWRRVPLRDVRKIPKKNAFRAAMKEALAIFH